MCVNESVPGAAGHKTSYPGDDVVLLRAWMRDVSWRRIGEQFDLALGKESEVPLTDWVKFPPIAESVRNARQFVADAFAGDGCPDTTIDDALLLVSELATNAVQHARTPFSVGFTHQGQTVTIEVADAVPERPSLREPDIDSGRGLHIVAAIAADWGVRDDPDGKTVFFRLPC